MLASFGRNHGLEEETAFKVARVFGGGLGEGMVCGAVTGALMAIGLAQGRPEPDEEPVRTEAHKKVYEFLKRYRQRQGSIKCDRLLGNFLGVEDGLKEARARDAFPEICPGIIREAGLILEELGI